MPAAKSGEQWAIQHLPLEVAQAIEAERPLTGEIAGYIAGSLRALSAGNSGEVAFWIKKWRRSKRGNPETAARNDWMADCVERLKCHENMTPKAAEDAAASW